MEHFALHQFSSYDQIPFDPELYSRLKFGDNHVATQFGEQLAHKVFLHNRTAFATKSVVVVPSPYNHIPNAATLMTRVFVDTLNHLLIQHDLRHVEYATVPRKITYTTDYGFLPKEHRGKLLENDVFYLNAEFFRDKLLLFVDDIRITGTHEDKIRDSLAKQLPSNDAMYLYYATYTGTNAEIEAKLNFARDVSVTSLVDGWEEDPTRYRVIVRPTKYLLGSDPRELEHHIFRIPLEVRQELYYGSLAEGYYNIPKYRTCLMMLRDSLK